MAHKGEFLADFVIYNKDDEVIAIGTREECRKQLCLKSIAIMDTLLSRPLVGWTIVKFWRGKYRCTTQGITEKVSKTFV